MTPPPRPAPDICLACRSLVDAGHPCPGGKGHEAVSTAKVEGRGRLDDEVWGPDSRARQRRRLARAGAGGGGIGAALEGCSVGLDGCQGLATAGEGIGAVLAGLALVAAASLFAIGLVWIVTRVALLVREALDRPKPHGALRAAPAARGPSSGVGTVRAGGTSLPVPWGAEAASAYAFELHARSVLGGAAMLRDACTAGFEIDLDDGRVLRIPPGRLVLDARLEPLELERARVDAYLAELDGSQEGGRSLFPYAGGRGLALRPGDRVEVVSELTAAHDDAGAQGGYRSAGALVPVGMPMLRVRRAPQARVRIAAGVREGGARVAPEEQALDEELEAPLARRAGTSRERP